MKVIVNGKSHDVSAATLEALLAELNFEGAWLATAVNCEIVRAADRPARHLNDGDSIEVLSPMQGG